MSLFYNLLKKGRFNIIPRVLLIGYATYWEFPDAMTWFHKYTNQMERIQSLTMDEGIENKALTMIRHTHRRLNIRYHWIDRGRYFDIIKTMEHRRFLETYERAKITQARTQFNWSKFPDRRYRYYPSFQPPTPQLTYSDADRYMGQFPLYAMRSVEGLRWDNTPDRLKHLIPT